VQEFPTVRGLLLTIAALVTLSAVIGLFAALTYKGTDRAAPGNRRITIDHVFNGTFAVEQTEVSWVPEGAFKKDKFPLVVVEPTGYPYML
jgi:dipeptidyl aminopeptidase B